MIVGLGNPGANYDGAAPRCICWHLCALGTISCPGLCMIGTRHNIGFAALDHLARIHGIDMKKVQKNASVGQGTIRSKKVLLVKPMTFMNNSGESVGPLSKYYKIPKERIIVVYDDLDLPLGKASWHNCSCCRGGMPRPEHVSLPPLWQVRVRSKGGHGGHNGMRSIIQHLQNSQDFPRIKIGIDRPPEGVPASANRRASRPGWSAA